MTNTWLSPTGSQGGQQADSKKDEEMKQLQQELEKSKLQISEKDSNIEKLVS